MTQTSTQPYRYDHLVQQFETSYQRRPARNRIVRVFLECSMSRGHQGLMELARTVNVDVTNLGPGEFVIFINRAKTALKMYAAANILVHLKMPEGRKLNMEAVRFIPVAFNAVEMRVDYDAANSMALEESFKRRAERNQ